MKIYKIHCLWVLCFGVSNILAIIVGSNTTVSKNSFVTFPARDKDNEMLIFASMSEGFALEDATTTCIFGSQFPVQKRMELNQGTLTLKTDLTIQNVRALSNLGDIRAEDDEARIVKLPLNLMTFGQSSQSIVFENIELQLGGNVTVSGAIEFEGVCKIVGGGKILNLADTGEFIVTSGSSLILQDVIITNIANNNIRCADDSAQLVLDGMEWIQTDDVIFDMGSILINETVNFIGTSTFVYDSTYTSTIGKDSEWHFKNGIMFRLGKHPDSNMQPLNFVDSTSSLIFDNCNLQITSGGIILTKGCVKFEKTVSFEFDSTSTSNGVILGINQSNEDCTIEFSPASVLNFNSGHFTYNNASPNKLISRSKSSRVVRHIGSHVYNAQDHTLSQLTLENSSLLVAPIVVNGGTTTRFEDVAIVFPGFRYDFTGNQYDAVTNLLSGNEFVTISNGRVSLGQFIVSNGNILSGNGVFAGPIVLADANAQATWSVNGALDASIIFNNGTLILANDLTMEPNGLFVGPGSINLNNYSVEFSLTNMNWTSPMRWTQGKIVLKENVSLSQTWTISGDFEIDGRRHLITFEDNGEIVVAENSVLRLRNLQIDKISGTKIRCIDNTGRIIIDNTRWVLGDYFRFIYGALQFMHSNSIGGNYIFAYQTQMTSTIMHDAMVTLGQNITFSYDPVINNKDLFEFINESSELVLKSSTIYTTTVGMSFKKGSMFVEKDSALSAEKIVISLTEEVLQLIDNGITFGDSIDASNDFYVQVEPGITLRLLQGSLNFRNLDSHAICLLNSYATLFIDTLSSLKVYENVVLSSGRIVFADRSILSTVPGNVFTASINPQGKLQRQNLTL